MSKLTLSVDKSVIARARRHARQKGISISWMVETYLNAVTEPTSKSAKNTPVLRALRGSLGKANPEDYKRHLVSKYK